MTRDGAWALGWLWGTLLAIAALVLSAIHFVQTGFYH